MRQDGEDALIRGGKLDPGGSLDDRFGDQLVTGDNPFIEPRKKVMADGQEPASNSTRISGP